MKIAGRQIVHRVALVLGFSAGLMLSMPQPAAAHKVEFRAVVSHAHHYYPQSRRAQSVVFPHRLRKDRDFQRWFVRSEYRFLHGRIRDARWHQLYNQYRDEIKHPRWRNRHFKGRVYIDLNRLPGQRRR